MSIRDVPTLSDAQRAEFERIVRQFKEDWVRGLKPEIEQCLTSDPALRRAVLFELVWLEVDLRKRGGEKVCLESYFLRFPELRDVRSELETDQFLLARVPGGFPAKLPPPEILVSAGDLLFGVLALRLQFISQDQLIAVLDQWSIDKSPSLIDIFRELKDLSAARQQLLEGIVAEHLHNRDFDTERSIADTRTVDAIGHNHSNPTNGHALNELDLFPPPGGLPMSTGIRYRILRPHTQGGLGQIWVAIDEELRREVALKEIQDKHAADPHGRARFLLEAEITGSLEHPGVVPVYGFGKYAHGRPYYAMRFIKGDSLKSAILDFHRPDHPNRNSPGQRQLDLRKLLSRFIDVCNTMDYAHSRGVIHRDLKPSNIMLGKYGETLVVDWGLAKKLGRTEVCPDELTVRDGWDSESSVQTIIGAVLGTPGYMSPEQAAGRLNQLGPPTDIYSLGATLYHLLTGKPPFQGSTNDVIPRVQKGDFPRPRQVNSEIPAPLEAICLKAMSLAPPSRYRSPRALSDDVEHWLADEPVSALRDTPIQRCGRIARRHRTVAIVGSAALAVITLVSLIAVIVTNNHLQIAGHERQRAEKSFRAETDARRTAEETIIDLDVTLGLAAQNERLPETALLWFAEAAKAVGQSAERKLANDVRFSSWRRQEVPYPVRAFLNPGGNVKDLVFSPCSRYLLILGERPGCVVLELETAKPVSLPDRHVRTTAAAWSNAGDQLALGTDNGEVQLLSFPSCEPRAQLSRTSTIEALAFSSDDRLLAIASKDLALWDRKAKTYRAEFAHPEPVKRIGFSKTGDKIVTACLDQQARVFLTDVQGVKEPIMPPVPHRLVTSGSPQSSAPLFLDRGSILVTVEDHRVVLLTDLNEKQALQRLETTRIEDVGGVAISPDEQRLLIYGMIYTETYDISDRTATPSETDFRHKSRITRSVFSPDGKTLLTTSADRTARLWPSAKPPGESIDDLFKTVPHEHNVSCAAYAETGRFFATAQTDGLVRVWSRHPGAVREIDTGAKSSSLVRLSSSGAFAVQAGWRNYRGTTKTQAYSTETGLPAGPVLQTKGALNDAAFSPDNQHVFTLSSFDDPKGIQHHTEIDVSQPGWIQFWNWRTGTEVAAAIATDAEPMRAIFSQSGDLAVVICANGSIIGLSWKEGDPGKSVNKLITTRHPGKLRQDVPPPQFMVKFSASGSLFATWGLGNDACVWSAKTGQQLAKFETQELCWDADFSFDETRLATASFDHSATVWDLRTKAPLMTYEHPDRVHGIRFSPDAKRVVTACRDRMTRVYDLSKIDQKDFVYPPIQHSDEGLCATFSADGRWIFTDTRSQFFRVWDPLTGKPVTPPIPIERSQGIIELTADGTRAVMSGAKINIVDLTQLLEPHPKDQVLDDTTLLAEILSGRRIVGASGVANLSTSEWLERWKQRPLKAMKDE